jgi:trans-aconitate methyltransferase
MICFARSTFPPGRFPNLRFCEMDARRFQFSEPFDLVFSNATLHWVDDHPAFLRSAATCLVPGGRLVVSCGGRGNAQEVFLAVRSTMRLKRWREFFRSLARPYFFHSAEEYERWLPRFGFRPGDARRAEKDTAFTDQAAFAGWFRTTWLPYIQRVPEAQREAFVADVATRYIAKHPPDAAGRIHVRMVRLEINAERPDRGRESGRVRSPSLQTGQAGLPQPAFQSVGALSRGSGSSPRPQVRRSDVRYHPSQLHPADSTTG